MLYTLHIVNKRCIYYYNYYPTKLVHMVLSHSSVLQIPGESTLKRNFHQIQVGEGRQTPNPFYQPPAPPIGGLAHRRPQRSESEHQRPPRGGAAERHRGRPSGSDDEGGRPSEGEVSPRQRLPPHGPLKEKSQRNADTTHELASSEGPSRDLSRRVGEDRNGGERAGGERAGGQRLMPPAEAVQRLPPLQGKLVGELN